MNSVKIELANKNKIVMFDDGDCVAEDEPLASFLFHLRILWDGDLPKHLEIREVE